MREQERVEFISQYIDGLVSGNPCPAPVTDPELAALAATADKLYAAGKELPDLAVIASTVDFLAARLPAKTRPKQPYKRLLAVAAVAATLLLFAGQIRDILPGNRSAPPGPVVSEQQAAERQQQYAASLPDKAAQDRPVPKAGSNSAPGDATQQKSMASTPSQERPANGAGVTGEQSKKEPATVTSPPAVQPPEKEEIRIAKVPSGEVPREERATAAPEDESRLGIAGVTPPDGDKAAPGEMRTVAGVAEAQSLVPFTIVTLAGYEPEAIRVWPGEGVVELTYNRGALPPVVLRQRLATGDAAGTRSHGEGVNVVTTVRGQVLIELSGRESREALQALLEELI